MPWDLDTLVAIDELSVRRPGVENISVFLHGGLYSGKDNYGKALASVWSEAKGESNGSQLRRYSANSEHLAAAAETAKYSEQGHTYQH